MGNGRHDLRKGDAPLDLAVIGTAQVSNRNLAQRVLLGSDEQRETRSRLVGDLHLRLHGACVIGTVRGDARGAQLVTQRRRDVLARGVNHEHVHFAKGRLRRYPFGVKSE